MKTVVIYTSQTGFTKKYAEWLGKRTNAEVLTLQKAKRTPDKKFTEADAIVYGGWMMAGRITGSEWFLSKANNWQGKKLAIFGVGASPFGTPDIEAALENAVTVEQKKFIKVFYCQGGLNYEKMKPMSRFAMRGFARMVKKKAEKEGNAYCQEMFDTLAKSYDNSNEKYLDPIMEYLGE